MQIGCTIANTPASIQYQGEITVASSDRMPPKQGTYPNPFKITQALPADHGVFHRTIVHNVTLIDGHYQAQGPAFIYHKIPHSINIWTNPE